MATRVTRNIFAPLCLLASAGYLFAFPERGTTNTSSFLQSQPRPRSFPHDQKEHRKVECAACHLGAKDKPSRTDQPMARDFPHATCVRCHNFAAEYFKAAMGGTSKFCTVCHENRRISGSDKALRQGVLSVGGATDFDDAFSHKAHRKVLPADLRISPASNPPYGSQFMQGSAPRCTDCHMQVKRTVEHIKDMRTESSHPTCFVCHGAAAESRRAPAEQFPYASDCKVCHALRGNTASEFRLSFGTIRDFKHEDHNLDIRPKKKSDFPLPTASDYLCSQCHAPIDQVETLARISLPEQAYCDQCHVNNKPGLPGRLDDDVLNRLKRR